MKFFWFGVVLLAFCVVCEVLSDYSESRQPSKEIRNRVHRTMRVNMRVGKRYGDSDFDDDVPKRRLRLRFRTGKRTFDDPKSHETDYTETQYDTDPYNTDILDEEPSKVSKRDFLNPNRRLRLVFRPGKRNFGNPEQEQLYGEPLDENFPDSHMTAPKRRLRRIMRTGKRNVEIKNTRSSLTPQAQSLDTDSNTEDFSPEPNLNTDYKRSAPQFLLNPRVGKNDKMWKIRPLENLQKRSDPKATDLWFGPRIGRSNDEQFEDIPWSYVILNANRLSNPPVLKSNDVEEQPNEEATE